MIEFTVPGQPQGKGRARKPVKWFTDADLERLRRDYVDYVARGELSKLADEMGRTRNFLCRKARSLGLTDKSRSKTTTKEDRSRLAKQRIATHGHPRGMAGKSHSLDTKEQIGAKGRDWWASLDEDQRAAVTLLQMKGKVALNGSLAGERPHGTWKAGWREIGGKRNYYRSRWEANYARYLEWLKQQGQIKDWQHEPETFWFEAIKRGVRSYLPDFRVWENDGSTPLHEVKGWMDSRSKTTLRRMAKYHPNEKIIVIRARNYNAIARKLGALVPDWEQSERRGRL